MRVGIVGLGKMGMLHWRTWRGLPDVQVVAIADRDARKADLVLSHGALFLPDSRALVGHVDIAIVATPSGLHIETAQPLLEAGVHCLVEKPLALDGETCRRMVACARRNGAFLAVGNSERFNRTVQAARDALVGAFTYAEIVRAVPLTGSKQIDCDVVQDLMVHDIDWLIDALGEPCGAISILDYRKSAGQLDHMCCDLTFSGNKHVRVTACRDGLHHRRQIILRDDIGCERIMDLAGAPQNQQPDALTLQAEAFLAALRGEASAISLGRQAVSVMSVIDRIRKQRSHETEATASLGS